MGLIGILDSGLGGLTIASACHRALPTWDLLYLGDTAHAPYGNKSPEAIRNLVNRGIGLLLNQGVDAIVLACSTACAALMDYRTTAMPAQGTLCPVPLFDVIQPGVDLAIKRADGGSIAILATQATVASAIYRKRLQQGGVAQPIFEIACPLLASHIDEGLIDHPATLALLRDYLSGETLFKSRTLLLGCTHFAFVRKAIVQILGRQIAVIDPAEICASKIAKALLKQTELKNRRGLWSWDFTDSKSLWLKRAERCLDQISADRAYFLRS